MESKRGAQEGICHPPIPCICLVFPDCQTMSDHKMPNYSTGSVQEMSLYIQIMLCECSHTCKTCKCFCVHVQYQYLTSDLHAAGAARKTSIFENNAPDEPNMPAADII